MKDYERLFERSRSFLFRRSMDHNIDAFNFSFFLALTRTVHLHDRRIISHITHLSLRIY